MAYYAVAGATSWGVTLAWLLSRNGHNVTVITRDEPEAEWVRTNRGIARLPAVVLPSTVAVAPPGGLPATIDGIVIAVPAQAVAVTIASLPVCAAPLLSAAKGLELGTARRMSEILAGAAGLGPVSVISGPNLSHEVAAGLPAAAVVASAHRESAVLWQEALSFGAFRAYTSDDVIGVELGGALKNVVAIAAGAAWGLEFGANAVATIMTRGLAEMTRLGVALGAKPLTFQGLAGVGDLAATCFSPLSRNRRLGELLARGLSPAAALAAIGEAVEGAATAPVALQLARRASVEMPIAEQVVAVLEGRCSVAASMRDLLSRPLGAEADV